MAEKLQNGRDNCKCRSHHQKMMQKFKTLDNLIRYYLYEEEGVLSSISESYFDREKA